MEVGSFRVSNYGGARGGRPPLLSQKSTISLSGPPSGPPSPGGGRPPHPPCREKIDKAPPSKCLWPPLKILRAPFKMSIFCSNFAKIANFLPKIGHFLQTVHSLFVEKVNLKFLRRFFYFYFLETDFLREAHPGPPTELGRPPHDGGA